jgi:hypothetical protein
MQFSIVILTLFVREDEHYHFCITNYLMPPDVLQNDIIHKPFQENNPPFHRNVSF